MLEFFRRLFAPEPRSSETAKERLRLVLLSDHLSLAPEVVEALKRDLLAVISRYLEIDPSQADVTFEQREREVAMLASIPIMGVRERTAATAAARTLPPSGGQELPAGEPVASAVAVETLPEAQQSEPEAAQSEPESAQSEPPSAVAQGEHRVEALPAAGPATTTSAARRRRRKKAAALANRQQPGSVVGFKPA